MQTIGQGAVKNIYNTFNREDNVLKSWSLAQLFRKPYRTASVAASDLDYATNPITSAASLTDPFPVSRTHENAVCNPVCFNGGVGLLPGELPVLTHIGELITSDPLFWATLKGTDPDQAKLFNENIVQAPIKDHWNITRQWAELAFWFPAQSGPVGNAGQPSVSFAGEYDFTFVGKGGVVDDLESEFLRSDPTSGADSHSFAQIKPLSDVWCVFKSWRQIMNISPDPDPTDPNAASQCVKVR